MKGTSAFRFFITQYRGAFQREPVGSASLEDKTEPFVKSVTKWKGIRGVCSVVLHGSFHFPRDFVDPLPVVSASARDVCDIDRMAALVHRLGDSSRDWVWCSRWGVPSGHPVVFWVCMV
ncbi:hypothetical protein CEXT_791121 [Caerostris extrusa]|uniref:Uncharacterized protein n=1 Tax=Caerostris extrusa TaxID=172846 RepID=A0AAV4S517_CAEEX|nr:hypothetical protein CEXT_791121 [Caerostris extrusa]